MLASISCGNCCEQAALRWLFAGSYVRTLVRSYASWAGTSWKGTAGQGPAIRTRQVLDRQDFLCVYVFVHPQVE